MPSAGTITSDVLICGGGPVGTLIGYQLLRNGCNPYMVDSDDKPNATLYGRACSLWPRALELFDQLDLGDDLLDVGIVSKTGLNFREGANAPGGLVFGYRMDKNGDSRWNFSLHLRQRLTELAIEKGIKELGHSVNYLTKLEGWTVNEQDEFPITCTVRNLADDTTYEVKTKYIVGADGGRSFVRKNAGIEFIGEKSGAEWIRMDAVVETDMPNPRTLNSIQSKDHGLILFCPIDHGRTRIGYVFNEELQKKHGSAGLTLEVAMEEAKKALHPFKLEFKKVDWFVAYGIGQCIASDFVRDRIILAGDACHTHSSGSAQGLNTGTFDATNLAWKLALNLRGLAKRELVHSYDTERRASVQQVIDNDKIIATLISGKLPPKFAGRTEHPRDILTEWFDNAKTQAFTLGLGVSYPQTNLVNQDPQGWPLAVIRAGERGPDVNLTRLGTGETLRLHRVLPNKGLFHLVVFTGTPHKTLPLLTTLRSHLDDPATNFQSRFPGKKLFQWTTIIHGESVAAEEFLGVAPFGRSYYDPCRAAHEIYGVDTNQGAIIVFRPDGYIATLVRLEESQKLGEYFARFLVEGAQ